MYELLELSKIATPAKVKKIQQIGKSDSKTDKLYWLIQKGQIKSDEDAIKEFYPGTDSKSALYQLKEKLYNKLINAVLIIDIEEKVGSRYTVAYSDCLKYCTAFEKIALMGAKKSTIKLGDKILKIALEYNIVEIVIRVSKVLIRKAVFVLKDEKKMIYYRNLFVKYSEIEQLQELARFYWVKISLRTSQKRMIVDKSLILEAQKYVDELQSKLMRGHTASTFSFIFSLKIRIEELNHNHEQVIKLIDEYLMKLKSYRDYRANYFTVALNKKLAALITLRNFDKAIDVADESLYFSREGASSWFTSLENIIILYFYQSQYSEALKVYQRARGNKGINFLPEDRQEIFKVYRAYLQFFINIDLLPSKDITKEYKTYRAAKFSNEVPIFSRDKTGINITIIIAQFLLLFTEGKYQKAIDKIESIKQYSHFHLRKDVTYRSNCFLKMLVKLIECNYHKAATIRKTRSLYEKLKNHPAEMQRQTNHVEIVPFEVLWEIILDSIDNSYRGKFKRKNKVKK